MFTTVHYLVECYTRRENRPQLEFDRSYHLVLHSCLAAFLPHRFGPHLIDPRPCQVFDLCMPTAKRQLRITLEGQRIKNSRGSCVGRIQQYRYNESSTTVTYMYKRSFVKWRRCCWRHAHSRYK